MSSLKEALETDAARRQEAIEAFAMLAGTGLLREAHAQLPAADGPGVVRGPRGAGRLAAAELLTDAASTAGEEA